MGIPTWPDDVHRMQAQSKPPDEPPHYAIAGSYVEFIRVVAWILLAALIGPIPIASQVTPESLANDLSEVNRALGTTGQQILDLYSAEPLGSDVRNYGSSVLGYITDAGDDAMWVSHLFRAHGWHEASPSQQAAFWDAMVYAITEATRMVARIRDTDQAVERFRVFVPREMREASEEAMATIMRLAETYAAAAQLTRPN